MQIKNRQLHQIFEDSMTVDRRGVEKIKIGGVIRLIKLLVNRHFCSITYMYNVCIYDGTHGL